MDSAQIIRNAVLRVTALRELQAADPALAARVQAVKTFQARRFAGTYADLLAGGSFQAAARFFLQELYCDKDFSERDAQFSRIAGALQAVFPEQVVETAVSLARLHVLTEELDHQMAEQWGASPEDVHSQPSQAKRYRSAWLLVGQRELRQAQLVMVQAIGKELSRLTRMPGLRFMLRMMRKPANVAGLGSLQSFLEAGFDTFAQIAGGKEGARVFLSVVSERETRLIDLLFDSDPVSCETHLDALLSLASLLSG